MKSYTTTEVAKLIRKELKAVFGREYKFSVRSSSYAGGSSIYVSWVDGPNQEQVDQIVEGFAGSGFDGMTDYQYSKENLYNGEPVNFQVDYVLTQRTESEELRKAATDVLTQWSDEPDYSFEERTRRACWVYAEPKANELFEANFEPVATVDQDATEENRLVVYPR